MTATLKRADAEKGYFMTDSSTWVAEKKNVANLTILFRGNKFLVNTYHTLSQPAGVTPGAATAAKFIDFVASEKGQRIILEFGKPDCPDRRVQHDCVSERRVCLEGTGPASD
jgi:tungstate transport system substrate-binding protein